MAMLCVVVVGGSRSTLRGGRALDLRPVMDHIAPLSGDRRIALRVGA
jgi:hypothetical protein